MRRGPFGPSSFMFGGILGIDGFNHYKIALRTLRPNFTFETPLSLA